MPSPPMVLAEGLCLVFGTRTIFRDVSSLMTIPRFGLRSLKRR